MTSEKRERADRVDERRTKWATFSGPESGPEFDDLKRANNDIIELVAALRNERAARQATQVELKAAREVVKVARSIARGETLDVIHFALPDTEDMSYYIVSREDHNAIGDALTAYDTARAGQGDATTTCRECGTDIPDGTVLCYPCEQYAQDMAEYTG